MASNRALTCRVPTGRMNADNVQSGMSEGKLTAKRDPRRLYRVEDATWWDIGCWQTHLCSSGSTACGRPALYFRWTGRRWWKLCPDCLVGHLDRNQHERAEMPGFGG